MLIAILKGSICFVADLMRHLEFSFILEFVTAASYGMRGTKPGELTLQGIDALDLKDKYVLLIDDILDTGKTLQGVLKKIHEKHPRAIKTAVFLRKKNVLSKDMIPDIVCFDIEDHFVIGYGLDYKEHFRGLKEIYRIDE